MMMSLSDLIRVTKSNIDLRDFNKPSISLALVNSNSSFAHQCEELKKFLFWEVVEVGTIVYKASDVINLVVFIKNNKDIED